MRNATVVCKAVHSYVTKGEQGICILYTYRPGVKLRDSMDEPRASNAAACSPASRAGCTGGVPTEAATPAAAASAAASIGTDSCSTGGKFRMLEAGNNLFSCNACITSFTPGRTCCRRSAAAAGPTGAISSTFHFTRRTSHLVGAAKAVRRCDATAAVPAVAAKLLQARRQLRSRADAGMSALLMAPPSAFSVRTWMALALAPPAASCAGGAP